MARKKKELEITEMDDMTYEVDIKKEYDNNLNSIQCYIEDTLIEKPFLDPKKNTCFNLIITKIGMHFRVDTKDIKEMNNRFEYYISLCAEYEQIPTEVGFAQFLGIHRSTFWDWCNRTKKSDSSYSDSVKRWKQFFEGELTDRTIYANNPAGSIFLLKNNHGYSDKQEIEVTPKGTDLDGVDLNDIARKLPKDIPIDVESKDVDL